MAGTGIPCQQEGPDLSVHRVPGGLPLSPFDSSSVLGPVEEVGDNPYRHKTAHVTQLLTPASGGLRQWSLTRWFS